MDQKIKDKSFTDILRDTQHNEKAKLVFLKLLARQKSKHRDWNAVKGETLQGDKSEVK
jgi:hypothetical protein